MENPELTFATPTILAGDRSLTSLVAHELAHSWSGNLVTNSTWNDFWLNEGFTVYFERRIMESLYGESYADMLSVLGYQDLMEEIKDLGAESNATKLKLDLKGKDPDDGMNDVAYEKGYFLLLLLEKETGRQIFDNFLEKYFSNFAFKSMTTEQFLEYLDKELLQGKPHLMATVKEWIYKPGIPANIPKVRSERFENVDKALDAWNNGESPSKLNTIDWSSHEWLHFIRHLPANISLNKMEELDAAFSFTNSGNSEILAAWLEHVITNKYTKGYDSLRRFLSSVGRRKFLLPLYKNLVKTQDGKQHAMDIYKSARPNYHSVSVNTIDEIVGWKN
jgi:leukotriene-A4 hydrolase